MKKQLYLDFAFGIVMVVAFTVFAAYAYAEPTRDIVEADFSHAVDIGPKTIPPGHYRFEQVRGRTDPDIFRVYGDNGEIATLTSIGFDASKQPGYAHETKVVLKKIGDKYYLDKIWIQGRVRGYEFPHTNVSRADLDSASEENVTAQSKSASDSSNSMASSNSSSSNQNSNSPSATPTPSSATPTPSSADMTSSATDSGVSTSSSNTPAARSAKTSYEGCIIGPEGGSYMLDVSGNRYVLKGDYDNVRESIGRVVEVWGTPSNNSDQSNSATSTQGATQSSTLVPLAIMVERISPKSEMCDARTGARLESGSSPNQSASNSQASGGVSGAATSANNAADSSSSSAMSSNVGNPTSAASMSSNNYQQSSAAGSTAQSQSSSEPTSVTGCLEQSGGSYSVRDANSGSTTSIVPQAALGDELSKQVGHQVRIVGSWSDTSSMNSVANTSGSSSTSSSNVSNTSSSSGSPKQFRAERIDVIALSCGAR